MNTKSCYVTFFGNANASYKFFISKFVLLGGNFSNIIIFLKGKADPYAVVSVGAKEYKTRILKNTINPVWEEDWEVVIEVRGIGPNKDTTVLP